MYASVMMPSFLWIALPNKEFSGGLLWIGTGHSSGNIQSIVRGKKKAMSYG